MNVKALKFQGVKAAVDVYLGEDDRGISILDRVVGVVKRLKETPIAIIPAPGHGVGANGEPTDKVYPTRAHVMRDAIKEIDKLDAFTLSDLETLLAIDVAAILLWGE